MSKQKSDSENSDSEEELECVTGLAISKEDAEKNYNLAGTLVDEPQDEISIAKYENLLRDSVHFVIMEVLQETGLSFKLADFQLLSLHVLGSQKNLILISPTGSGKMLGESSCV